MRAEAIVTESLSQHTQLATPIHKMATEGAKKLAASIEEIFPIGNSNGTTLVPIPLLQLNRGRDTRYTAFARGSRVTMWMSSC